MYALPERYPYSRDSIPNLIYSTKPSITIQTICAPAWSSLPRLPGVYLFHGQSDRLPL
ncbi:hypothetical protein [Serratia symbiotica]|uniref:hypothetical protein n=1 Tax=Serratia symbiotica TaxID=138074 RepID=UPI0030CE2544